MSQREISAAISLVILLSLPVSGSADWLTMPSTYTHDPVAGNRVGQYAPIEAPAIANQQPLRSSGYTHYRSTLAYGQSADNYHRVEEWGDPVRPYGEWRFPYRPFSTPYPNWGPPFGGLGSPWGIAAPGFGFGFGGGFAGGFGGGFQPGGPGPQNPGGMNGGGMNWGGGGFGGGGFNPGYGPQPDFRPGFRPGFGFPNPAAGADGFAPYPSGRGTPYPVPPYYDGYYPNYRD